MSNVKKLNKGYEASFSKGSGCNRVRINRRFKTKTEAIAFIAEQTLKHNSNGKLFRRRLLISAYLKYWLKFEKNNISEETLHTYKTTINHVQLVLPRIKMHEINRRIIQSAINLLSQRYAHETVRKDVSHLKAMFRAAVRMGDIHKNPMEDITVPADRFRQKSIDEKVMPESDFKKIKNYLLNYDYHEKDCNRLVVLLIIFTGIRVGEALGLSVENVDFKNNSILINQSWKTITKTVGTTKTPNSVRKLPVQSKVLQKMKNWRYLGHTTQDGSNGKLFFQTFDGRFLQPASINACYQGLQKKLKIAGNYSIHTVRHTIASLLLEKGADIVQVSRLLGHSSPKITATYYLGLTPDKGLNKRRTMLDMLE